MWVYLSPFPFLLLESFFLLLLLPLSPSFLRRKEREEREWKIDNVSSYWCVRRRRRRVYHERQGCHERKQPTFPGLPPSRLDNDILSSCKIEEGGRGRLAFFRFWQPSLPGARKNAKPLLASALWKAPSTKPSLSPLSLSLPRSIAEKRDLPSTVGKGGGKGGFGSSLSLFVPLLPWGKEEERVLSPSFSFLPFQGGVSRVSRKRKTPALKTVFERWEEFRGVSAFRELV